MTACFNIKPVHAPQVLGGLNLAASENDGNQIRLRWDRAYPNVLGHNIAYNIYYSTQREDILSEGIKFVALNTLEVCISDLPPGQTYFFVVRATEYNPDWYDLDQLQDGFDNDLKIYTEGILLSNIDEDSLEIPITDIESWPNFGVIQIGGELIRYSSKDIPNNNLIVSQRGFLGTEIRIHNTDGYDGYSFRDPVVKFFKGYEDDNLRVQTETSTFFEPNYAFTFEDGYATVNDKLNPDFSNLDEEAIDFPRYDQVGWHRTDPRSIVKGKCIGTYIGGEQFCADSTLGVGRQTRGVSLNDQAMRREELLLESVGQAVVLVRRLWEGIRCPCVKNTNEQPEYRCRKCFGTGFITGYQQYFNPRRADRRILVRPSPYGDNLPIKDAGIESEAILDLWTLPVPTIKQRDFIIRFNSDGTEEFRYEVIEVTRNVLFEEAFGVQKFRAQRVRKTDPIVQWRALDSAENIPRVITTSIGTLAGADGNIIPHTHTIVVSDKVTQLSQINQTTSVSMGHNHTVKNGIIQDELGHSHQIIL